MGKCWKRNSHCCLVKVKWN